MAQQTFGVNLLLNTEFKNPEAKNFFNELEAHLTEEQIIREQIEYYKRHPTELARWAAQEKIKNRSRELVRNGLHPII
jgi:hypothetical protein